MPKELHIYDGGTFRQADEVHIYDGGSWRDCDEVYIYDGSVWRQAFIKAGVVTLTDHSHTPSPGSSPLTGKFKINSDGTVDADDNVGSYSQINSSTDWIIPNAAASSKTYHVKATVGFPFTSPTTGTTGSWLEVGVDTTEWTFTVSGGSGTSGDCNLTIAISDDGGTSTIDTCTVSWSYEVL